MQTGISNHLIDSVKAVGFGPIGIIVAVCLLYIVMGAFLEGIGMLLVTVPITLPLVLSFGYDPIWFGVLLVILVEIGLIHPPMGMNLFAINAVTKDITIFDIYKGSAPFLIAPIVLISLMIAYPQIVMWLPSQLEIALAQDIRNRTTLSGTSGSGSAVADHAGQVRSTLRSGPHPLRWLSPARVTIGHCARSATNFD